MAFRSFAREGGHPKRNEEMVGLCEFNTRLTRANVHTYVANEGLFFTSEKRGGCCGRGSFSLNGKNIAVHLINENL